MRCPVTAESPIDFYNAQRYVVPSVLCELVLRRRRVQTARQGAARTGARLDVFLLHVRVEKEMVDRPLIRV